jgi:two-component system sensor histidine kinase KdpD
MRHDSPRRLIRVAGALASIAALTLLYSRVIRANSTTVALSFLLAILGLATRRGLLEAIVASFAGALCFNYFFLPPVGTFTVADPENWVALGAFLVTAVVASQLSASARKRAREAARRQHEMERLYGLSRALLLLDTKGGVAGQLAGEIARVFRLPAVALSERATQQVHRAGPEDIGVPDGGLREAAERGTRSHDPAAAVSILPVTLGSLPLGSLAVRGEGVSGTALEAVASLAAIALERARAAELAGRAEAARQSEELKSTLLDALAHEFKTPLTSIKVAVSALLADEGAPPRELLTIVEEETDRLNALVSEAIQMARIDAGKMRLERRSQTVPDLVSSALGKMGSAAGERDLRLEIPDPFPDVVVDGELVGLVIRQLLGNALKYSEPDSPISIRAHGGDGWVTIAIHNRGPGISPEEQSRIFERFYRIAESGAPGTGMGLAIARNIVEAHGGRIWVESRPGEGSEFSFTIPCAVQEVEA